MKLFGQHKAAAWLVVVVGAGLLLACGTGKGAFKGDSEVREVERRVQELNTAIEDKQLDAANHIAERLDDYVQAHRTVLELHPEASMMFTRIDSAHRRLRRLRKDSDAAARERARIETEVAIRRPLEQAAELTQGLSGSAARPQDLSALREAIADAQDQLNAARRDGRVQVGGEFANEIEQRLAILRETATRAERLLRVAKVGQLLVDARASRARAEAAEDASAKVELFGEARDRYQGCVDLAARLIQEDARIARRVIAVGEGAKLPVKKVARTCGKGVKRANELIAKAQKAVAAVEAMQAYASDKSADQQRVLRQWKRKPDVVRTKKGVLRWTFVEKKKVKRGRRKRSVKTLHEYSFDADGALVGEKTRRH